MGAASYTARQSLLKNSGKIRGISAFRKGSILLNIINNYKNLILGASK